MTDEEMAEKYVDTLLNKDDPELDKLIDENLGDLELNKKQAGTLLGIIKGVGICSYLAGLKAGRPKWHKVADGDLPKHEVNVLVLFNKQCVDIAHYNYDYKEWHFADSIVRDVIAWCEIPRYAEGGVNYDK